MLAVIDIENYKKDKGIWTPVLDATGRYFTLGVVLKETGGHKAFTKPQEMWNYILELGEKEFKRGKKLTVYGHNIRYDFYQVANLNDRNLFWFSEEPFIVSLYKDVEREFDTEEAFLNWKRYADKNKVRYKVIVNELGIRLVRIKKEYIKFLDTFALYRMSLKKVGDIIGMPKTEIPIEIGEKMTNTHLSLIKKYCLNDCKVTLGAVKYLKDKMADDNVNIRNLCTINQVAISYIVNELRKMGNLDHILMDNSEFLWKCKNPNLVHSAYRGGFVRAFQTGKFSKVTSIDCNSLYPYSATRIRFPDLRTESFIKKPLKSTHFSSLFKMIGVSRAMLYNKSDKLGLLMIRTPLKSYTPKVGQYLIGTWTHDEILEALNNGYELKDVEWSIVWEEGSNPFKELFNRIYIRRMNEADSLNKYFYKSVLNCGIGKFGQRRTGQQLFVDSVEKLYEYLQKKHEVIKGIDGQTDLLYKKVDTKEKFKKYYAPIIPALITARARIYMYNNFKKIPLKDLLYTDTDSIVMRGDYVKNYKMGSDMGEFKIDTDIETNEPLRNVEGMIRGTKSKLIGNNIALSGVFKKGLTAKDFIEGTVKTKKMITLRDLRDKRIGEFVEEVRDLNTQEKKFKEIETKLANEVLHIDCDIDDISFFTKEIAVIHEKEKYINA